MHLEIGVGNAIRVNKQVLSPAHEAKYLKKFPQIMTYETKSEKWVEKDSSYAIDDKFWEEVEKDLVRDGYLKKDKKKVNITVTDKITVNGKALSAADQARYLKKFPQLQR